MMRPYTSHRRNSVRVTRKVVDDNDKELMNDSYCCHNIGDALDTVRNLFEKDKMMYDCLTYRTKHSLVKTYDECVDDGYAYTMYVRKNGGGRRVTTEIENIEQYAHLVFGFYDKVSMNVVG